MAAPGLCGEQVEWRLHTIDGLTVACELAAQKWNPICNAIELRHCVQVNTSWKYKRDHVPRYHPLRHRYDAVFARALVDAFPGRRVFRQYGGLMERTVDILRQFLPF